MGIIYRKRCESCDAGEDAGVTFSGLAGAVIADPELGGEIITDGYLAYLGDAGELIPLPHPVEELTLREQGVAWRIAALRGRLLHIHNLICVDCGVENTTASLSTFTGTGCLVGILLAVGMVLANTYLIDLPGLIEYSLVWLAAFAPSIAVDAYVRFRYSGNCKRFRFRQCIGCGGNRVVSVAGVRKQKIVCPRCGKLTITIEIAGIS